METPAVSLLVAVYNTETYIRTCLESLRNQTVDNIEIIIVNDGSADASPDIAEEYAKMDNRFKVIHQENKGSVRFGIKALKLHAANLSRLSIQTIGSSLIIASRCSAQQAMKLIWSFAITPRSLKILAKPWTQTLPKPIRISRRSIISRHYSKGRSEGFHGTNCIEEA